MIENYGVQAAQRGNGDEMKQSLRLLSRKRTFLFLFVVIFLMVCVWCGPGSRALATSNGYGDDANDIIDFLNTDGSAQGSQFADLVLGKTKYITSRSLCGKNGEWLAFIDFYEEYQNGISTGNYLLQRGTLQYGLQPLPETAKTSTLYVGSKTYYSKADKQSMFTFRTAPPLTLPSTANGDEIKMSVTAGRQTTSILLEDRYPHRDFEDIQTVLEEMAPAYASYLQKRDGNFDHAFLRLRSYVTDAETLGRVYSWELTLVAEESLPSKGIVIRYDCDTGKVAGAVNREIRSYFG